MKKLIFLLIIFFFIYPIYPIGFPLPIDRIYQGLGLGLLVIGRKDLIKLLGTHSVIVFLRYTIILFVLAFFARLVAGKGDMYFIIQVINIIFAFFSAYFIFWCARFIYKGGINLGLVLYYIVIIAIIQTLISSYFFLNPQHFETYLSYLNPKTNQGIIERLGLVGRRFLGIGSQFFSGSIKYGVAFFTLLILPYVHKCKLTSNKFLYWVALLLISAGGLLTGRTFFVAIALGVFMILRIEVHSVVSFIRVNMRLFLIVLGSLLGMYLLALLFIGARQLNMAFGFVFEIFINFSEGGSFESSSTNTLKTMYKFPETLKTWFIGDGRMQGDKGGYYMRTDVGYIRLLFYFGLPATFFFALVWWRYYRILRKLAFVKLPTLSRPLKTYFFILLLWLLILNFKGLTLLGEYFVLFLVFLVLSPSVLQKDNSNKT